MKNIAIIPARYASSRLPGKPLLSIMGKSMIQRVYEQVSLSQKIAEVIVATDDVRIAEHVEGFGGKFVMTSSDISNGTLRCWAAFLSMDKEVRESVNVLINVQGDEPLISPRAIENLLDCFQEPNTKIATLAKKIENKEELFNPNTVKVVLQKNANALYFSRQVLPYCRDEKEENWLDKTAYYKHIGLYAYRPDSLETIVSLPKGVLEECEKLEQLRWLENGLPIKVQITDYESYSVDTSEDLKYIEKIIQP